MKTIENGIVFSNDIKRILNGINAFDYKYEFIPQDSVIKTLRESFKKDTEKIFKGKVSIITEEEMMGVNSLITGEYPHRIIR